MNDEPMGNVPEVEANTGEGRGVMEGARKKHNKVVKLVADKDEEVITLKAENASLREKCGETRAKYRSEVDRIQVRYSKMEAENDLLREVVSKYTGEMMSVDTVIAYHEEHKFDKAKLAAAEGKLESARKALEEIDNREVSVAARIAAHALATLDKQDTPTGEAKDVKYGGTETRICKEHAVAACKKCAAPAGEAGDDGEVCSNCKWYEPKADGCNHKESCTPADNKFEMRENCSRLHGNVAGFYYKDATPTTANEQQAPKRKGGEG